MVPKFITLVLVSMTVVINYHKLGGLKQWKSLFSEGQNSEIKVSAGLCSPRGPGGESASGGYLCSLGCGCIPLVFMTRVFKFLFALSSCRLLGV